MTIKAKITTYFELVKFEHSIFALPFALCGMIFATPNGWGDPLTFLWVIIAMISGRTAAMALNRIIDRKIDKLNPRTKDREIPAGKIKPLNALILTIISLVIMVLTVLQLPIICIYLLPVAIFIIVIYSYCKRFTVLSHFILGFVLGSAAIGGWLAVSGSITLPAILYGAAVTLWVTGFDIIYSTQDIDFDKQHQLHSLPAKIGLKHSITISRICHILTVLLLIIVGLLINTSWGFWAGVILIGSMLTYEQSIISAEDLSKVNLAFFNINGIISIGFFTLIIIGKLT